MVKCVVKAGSNIKSVWAEIRPLLIGRDCCDSFLVSLHREALSAALVDSGPAAHRQRQDFVYVRTILHLPAITNPGSQMSRGEQNLSLSGAEPRSAKARNSEAL